MQPQKRRSRLWIVLTLCIAGSLALAGVAVAQLPVPATEPNAAAVAASGDSAASYDSANPVGSPPDENRPAGRARPSGVGVAATFSYYQVSGATLRGRNSSTGYAYDGVGCSHVTVGTGTGRILNTELVLPDNAVVKYLRVYYNDTNAASGVQGFITRYNPGVATTDLVSTGSTGAFAGGYGFVVSTEITETVNNTSYAYTLIGWPDDANVANQICGLRVAYYAPPFGIAFLPVIQR